MSGLSSDPGQLTTGVWVARTAVGPLVSRLDCLEHKSFTPWSSLTSAHMVQSPVLVLSAPRVGPGSYRGFGQSPSSGEAGSSDDGPSEGKSYKLSAGLVYDLTWLYPPSWLAHSPDRGSLQHSVLAVCGRLQIVWG